VFDREVEARQQLGADRAPFIPGSAAWPTMPCRSPHICAAVVVNLLDLFFTPGALPIFDFSFQFSAFLLPPSLSP
jgi:hypothetical protein